jgi:hypothetical protein
MITAAPPTITFIKILTAPPTWKSEPIFAEPRYLIRALAGEYRLFHYRAQERSYVAIGSAASRIEAERAAERHLAAGADAVSGAQGAGITLSA